jgi:hypothetical protein
MSKSKNRALRTSVWRDMNGEVSMDVVYIDDVAKSKWSVVVSLTDEQADSLALRLTAATKKEAT